MAKLRIRRRLDGLIRRIALKAGSTNAQGRNTAAAVLQAITELLIVPGRGNGKTPISEA